MKTLSALGIVGTLGLLLVFDSGGKTVVGAGPRANLQPPGKSDPGTPEGIEVLARGPVHEAFAHPVMRRQGPAEIVPKKPPAPVNEMPPEKKPEAANVQWIPGYWAFDQERRDFLWVSGIWRVPPPSRHWVPGYWQQEADGWLWVSGYWGDQTLSEEELYPPPPDPIAEAQPPAPDDNSSYVPGCWVYNQSQYWWRPGFWVANRPGWVWNSDGYYWTPAGYAFVHGYWDHDFNNRGLLFAPVYVDPRFYGRPGWSYRPGFAIAGDLLLQALFVRVASNSYFFGDYYDRRYAGLGYQPWVDFRVGDRFHDPLFSYYRWSNRNNPRWEQDLHAVYKARQEGTMERPPRTLTEQHKIGAAQTALVVPLNQVKSAEMKLQPISDSHQKEVHQASQQLRNLSQNRAKFEAQVKATTSPANATNAVKIELPKQQGVKPPAATKTPPPAPAQPKLQPHHPQQGPPRLEPRVQPRPPARANPSKGGGKGKS